jgi:release factor glutamine methyltransferase
VTVSEHTPATWRRLLDGAAESLGDRVDARWIIEVVAGVPLARLLAGLDELAPPGAAEQVSVLVERRRSGEPLQHVVGRWGFRRLDVAVDGRALVPRPETELLVELALTELDRFAALGTASGLVAVDLGTGSGVIALSLAAEREGLEVFGVDRSEAALGLARENLGCLDARARRRVTFLEGDWFSPLPVGLAGHLALVVSNPPYLAAGEWPALEAVVRDHDPYEALVAGPTGLEAIERLVAESPRWLAPGGSLVIEIAPHQREAVLGHVADIGPAFSSASVTDDLAGRPRALVARRSVE